MLVQARVFALAVVSSALGAPAAAPAQVTDTDVLQFALTLEHLESAFYTAGLAKFDEDAFAYAGFPDWVRARFVQIAAHEGEHVSFLSDALGPAATNACDYNFPFDDPRSFAGLSMALEAVGDSAYIGAAQLVSDKGILTTAASILSVEAHHAAWVSSAVLKHQAWNGPFDSPLTPSGAFSLASLFINSCPASNPALPVTAFPPVTISNAAPEIGSTIKFTFTPAQGQAVPGAAFIAWLNGLGVVFSDLAADGTTTVPEGLAGTVFAAVVTTKDKAPDDTTMLTGFGIVQFPFDSRALTELDA